MNYDIIGAVISALIGFAIAYLNYVISKYVLKKSPQKYSFTTVLRQVIQIAYLAAVYFIGEKTGTDIIYLLVGAVLGMTLPMLYFTKKLINFNEAFYKTEKGKEEKD